MLHVMHVLTYLRQVGELAGRLGILGLRRASEYPPEALSWVVSVWCIGKRYRFDLFQH